MPCDAAAVCMCGGEQRCCKIPTQSLKSMHGGTDYRSTTAALTKYKVLLGQGTLEQVPWKRHRQDVSLPAIIPYRRIAACRLQSRKWIQHLQIFLHRRELYCWYSDCFICLGQALNREHSRTLQPFYFRLELRNLFSLGMQTLLEERDARSSILFTDSTERPLDLWTYMLACGFNSCAGRLRQWQLSDGGG